MLEWKEKIPGVLWESRVPGGVYYVDAGTMRWGLLSDPMVAEDIEHTSESVEMAKLSASVHWLSTQVSILQPCGCDACQCFGEGACRNEYDPEGT